MLNLELASGIPAAGWCAELGMPAEDGSWRAYVMASSLDDTQRIAWEALTHSRRRSSVPVRTPSRISTSFS
jgi:competence protein CoiA